MIIVITIAIMFINYYTRTILIIISPSSLSISHQDLFCIFYFRFYPWSSIMYDNNIMYYYFIFYFFLLSEPSDHSLFHTILRELDDMLQFLGLAPFPLTGTG